MFYNTNFAILHSLTFSPHSHTHTPIHTQLYFNTNLPSANTYTWQTTSLESWPLRSPLQPLAQPAAQKLQAKEAPAAVQTPEKLTAANPSEVPLQSPYGAFLAAQPQPEKLRTASPTQVPVQTPYGAFFVAQPQPEKLTAANPSEVQGQTPYGAYFPTLAQPQKLTAANPAQVPLQTPYGAYLQAQPAQISQHVPQALSAYGALQSTQTHGNLLLLNSPYYAAYSLPLAYVAPSVVSATEASVTTTTAKPSTVEEVEPVDAEDESDTIETLQKLQAKTQTAGDLKSDKQLRAAVSRINTDYVIEEIVAVPGKHVISTSSKQAVSKKPSGAAKLHKASGKLRQSAPVKVEATGRTSSSSKNFPQIPFGTYFLPYRPEQAKALQGRKQAALVLEPHSKAVVGNGGTAISTPISRALLKKGVPTNVYFNPESVAIAGVGGKAHATADLELDLFN